MTDITPELNEVLKAREVAPVTPVRYSIDRLDEFLKEAYSINARISDLTAYLRAIRPAYLSTAAATRPQRHDSLSSSRAPKGREVAQRHLTDAERTAIDAEAKTLLRQLHATVTQLSQVEKVRQDAVRNIALRKRAKTGLGAIGRWAAGGAITAKSPEEEREEAEEKSFSAHREGVVWYLQSKLGEAGKLQAGMMEIRLQREEEKRKSILYKNRGANMPYEKFSSSAVPVNDSRIGGKEGMAEDDDTYQQLSQEQMQLFEEENQGMLRQIEDQLDAVKATHRSLEEVAELQTTLATNLATQQEHIDQLVQDSFSTTENVGRGNKELKRATERTSTARLLFHGTCAFCTFLIVWDLIF